MQSPQLQVASRPGASSFRAAPTFRQAPRPRSPRRPSRLPAALGWGLVAGWMAMTAAAPAQAQSCDRSGCGWISCGTPATPVPAAFWGELQPLSSQGPLAGDVTSFYEYTGQYSANPYFFSINIQNGWAFTGMDYGVMVWDVSGGAPVQQSYLSYVSFPFWTVGEQKTPLQDVSLPKGVDTIGTVGGISDVGLSIIDFTSKTSPSIVYQNAFVQVPAVYAATLGGTHYAFGATNLGLLAYNMDAAKQLAAASGGQPCREDYTPGTACHGVYVGAVTNAGAAYVAGADQYLVASYGANVGFDIWDVSNPAAPVHKLTALQDRGVSGVAMWKDLSTGHYLVGARIVPTSATPPGTSNQLEILDVNCITGSCGSAPAVLSTYPDLPDSISQTASYFLTLSFSGNTPFLYLGSDEVCGVAVPQREWLLDVSNPNQPRDITPPSTGNGGYWGWYYRANPTGFNNVMPRKGMFWGQNFYRVAQSIFDVHKHVGAVAPSAAFTWSPQTVYPNTPVSFTDQSSGQPTSWAWTFAPDGSPSSSAVQSPAGVSFPTAGQKSVTLVAQNNTGKSSLTQTVNVLNPAPAVGGVTVSPASPLQCQPVTLTATGVTGQPPLTYAWSITSNNNPATGGTSAANPFVWDTKANAAPPASYTATVQVSGTGTPATGNVTFTLGSLASLPASGAFAPTNDAFAAGTVQFHVNVAGATEWNWNFGDNPSGGPAGDGYSGWTTDPTNGPNPSHTYTAVATYAVTVKVRNCVNIGGATSSPLQVQITQTTPLIASFAPTGCISGFCVFSSGSPITFIDSSTGAACWDYDWDGSGAFADAGHTQPVTSHTYNVTTQTTFFPALRVHRVCGGVEQNTSSFTTGIIVLPAQPAQIFVSGPSSGVTNTPYTFSATASNCTPSATWTWTANGGTISGSATGSSISVSYANAGSYSVAASNAGCSGAFNSAGITISGGGGGGGGGGGTLQAAFTFSPPAPKAGDVVTFDGTSSTGSPANYSWDFGDGITGSGATAQHAYPSAGTYTVKLDVEKPGTGTGCLLGTCVSETTKSIVVQSGTPAANSDFTSSAGNGCTNIGGFWFCTAVAGQPVTLTGLESNPAATFAWDFGDGSTGSGSPITHTFSKQGNPTVTLTVSGKGLTTTSTAKTFQVAAPPAPQFQSMVLPYVVDSRGALVQSCDLYLHNPGSNPEDVTLQFLKRGTPDVSPPQSTSTVQPGATLYAPNVLQNVFNRQNISGFVVVTVKTSDPLPIVTSFNTFVGASAGQFGQTISGVPLPSQSSTRSSQTGSTFQYLIGLNDNGTELAYFGITNPSATGATYHLRLFDNLGNLIGESKNDLSLGPHGQRQFQTEDITTLFGVSSDSDYLVSVENKSAATLFPYGENVRLVSGDPTFIIPGAGAATQYVLGAYSTAGTWQSDVVLANTSTQPINLSLTFTRPGVLAPTTAPVTVTLNAGQTQRLADAITAEWNLNNTVGVITVSAPAGGPYPLVQAESYSHNSQASARFGQTMRAFADADAAAVGQGEYLVGLRQDAGHQTTLWLFNPSSDYGVYDVIFRGLDGTVLAKLSDVSQPPGRLRQYQPAQLPLPAGGVTNGFTVQILVKNGKALAAAQVLTTSSGDPAYIQGVAR
jgi:PKD repeat protein